jgi:hypothetical protein
MLPTSLLEDGMHVLESPNLHDRSLNLGKFLYKSRGLKKAI